MKFDVIETIYNITIFLDLVCSVALEPQTQTYPTRAHTSHRNLFSMSSTFAEH